MPDRTRRSMSLTPDHVARVFRDVPKTPAQRYAELSPPEWEALVDAKLAELGTGPFWVFAYGSLIWNPAFDHVEALRGRVHGWRRSFCLHMTNWRATPEEPGLMLALDRGGACTGMVYRLPDDDRRGRMQRLLEREVSYHVDLPWLRWLNVRTEGSTVRALTFYCAPPGGDADLKRLSKAEQARILAGAVGHRGSCAEYLYNTVDHLEALGIRDRYLWELQHLVAAEIDRLQQPS